mmetsp:Transcript_26532/g.61937  ORF Transcript_26532/g.61937 Transcript_26532/m.61937 type:complete len:381 (-) Transcript_26532:83-1225(-)
MAQSSSCREAQCNHFVSHRHEARKCSSVTLVHGAYKCLRILKQHQDGGDRKLREAAYLRDLEQDEVVFAVASDGQELAVAFYELRIEVWDMPTVSLIAHQDRAHACPMWRICYNSQRRQVVTGAADRCVKVWSVFEQGLRLEHVFHGHSGNILALACDFTEQWAVSGGSVDFRLRVWNFGKREEPKAQKCDIGHAGTVNAVAIGRRAPDAEAAAEEVFIISASDDGSIRISSRQTLLCVKVLRIAGFMPRCLQVSPGMEMIVAAGGEEIYAFRRHLGDCGRLDFKHPCVFELTSENIGLEPEGSVGEAFSMCVNFDLGEIDIAMSYGAIACLAFSAENGAPACNESDAGRVSNVTFDFKQLMLPQREDLVCPGHICATWN